LALRWFDIDLDVGELHVERSYDPKSDAFVAPGSPSANAESEPRTGLRRQGLRPRINAEKNPSVGTTR
jgi:hypothetical protein